MGKKVVYVNKKSVLLTISLLISNRPDTVRKCLDSVKPLLENVSSELILTDTGCGEQVREIIEEYTDNIIEFEWCNDFSKARNAGLRKAKGQWFLFLDDDEWFEDVTEIIDFFNSGEYKKYGMGAYFQRNFLDSEGKTYTELLTGRMVRLEPDVRFVYSIHECFNRVPGPVKKFSTFVHHYGYIYKSDEEARAHSERNVSLLLTEHEKHPKNMKHTLQLVQEFKALRQFDKALEMCKDGIAWSEKGKVEEDFCTNSLYSSEIDVYILLQRFDDALEKGEKYLREQKLDPLTRAVIAGDLAGPYIDKNQDGKCMECVGIYWDIYRNFLENDKEYIQYTTITTANVFEALNRCIVLSNGVRAAVHLGLGELAWQWFQGLDWEGNAVYVGNEMIKAILSRMPKADRAERSYYSKMCNIIIRRKELEDYVLSVMKEVFGWFEGSEDKKKMIASFGDVEIDNWITRLGKVLDYAALEEEARGGAPDAQGAGSGDGAGTLCKGEEIEELAASVWEKMEESLPLMKDCDIFGATGSLGVKAERILGRVPFYKWREGVENIFLNTKWNDIVWWDVRLGNVLPADDMRMLAWRAYYNIYGAKQIAGADADASGRDEDGMIGSMEEILRGYAQCQMALCEKIYLPEAISGMPDVLPADFQAAYYIKNMLDFSKEGKYAEAVAAIREIRRLLPGLDTVLKRYLKWLDSRMKRQKQEAEQANGELQVLARQIKAKIRVLMDAGQNQAALGVVNQLLPLLPGDEELKLLQRRLGQ